MAITNSSAVVSFDGDAAAEAVREAVEGTLFSMVEYDTEDWGALYVDDATMAFYADETEMEAHFERIHSHVNLDFAEIALVVDDLFPIADEVYAITTKMDYLKVVRIYGDREGVFMALETDEPVEPLVAEVRAVMAG